MQPYKFFLFLCMTMFGFATPRLVLAAEDAAKLFEDTCSECHHPKKKPLDKKHMTREKWKESIDLMIEKDKLDPPLKPEQYTILLDWLASTHGPADTATTGADTDASKK
jgi:hypothetical protein